MIKLISLGIITLIVAAILGITTYIDRRNRREMALCARRQETIQLAKEYGQRCR